MDRRHLLLISADTLGHGDVEMSGTGVLTYDFAFKQLLFMHLNTTVDRCTVMFASAYA